MSVAWKPADYKDDFREKLSKVINEQIAAQGKKRRPKPEATGPATDASTNVVDFMALLKKSLATKARSKERSEKRSKTA
jgi:DNA end-binding protein Ku